MRSDAHATAEPRTAAWQGCKSEWRASEHGRDGDHRQRFLANRWDEDVLLGATDGTLILFDVDSLRKLGRMSRGVVGMKLREIKSGASSSSSSSSSGNKSEEDVEEEDEDDDFMIQAEDDDDDDFDDDAAGGVEIVGEDEAKTLATTAG